jgi:hypothetical protein
MSPRGVTIPLAEKDVEMHISFSSINFLLTLQKYKAVAPD